MHNTRFYSARLEDYQKESNNILIQAQYVLHLKSIQKVEVVDIFDFKDLDATSKEKVQSYFKSNLNSVKHELDLTEPYFHIKAVEGQFDDVYESVKRHLQVYFNIENDMTHSLLFIFEGADPKEVQKYKNVFVNDKEFVPFDTEYVVEDTTAELKPVENFIAFNDEELLTYKDNLGMDIDDLVVVQDYFKSIDRNPSLLELKIIDTYWSDHCRHTTFFTHFNEIEIEDERVQKAYNSYLETRQKVYTSKDRALTLMDIATINAKEIAQKGLLEDWDKSQEVNAISLNVDIDVDNTQEKWQILFKNETHNHPTEVEPYGGASTCFGGCVRDPLSGRGTVYQAMRISGSKSPLTSFEETRDDKLMSRTISQKAAEGYSDYANQMGVKSGYLQEVYHDGYEAKRFELGALVAAVPYDYVRKEEPLKDDIVLLLGGETGRDGLGAAVGSSAIQTESSLQTVGAEVQKGNPIEEHKITRLFRHKEVLDAIKRCNDFGAGGVSVAVGELADGVHIDLDKVHLKYEMHAGEVALSESQERMAVIIDPSQKAMFEKYCELEGVAVSEIATISDDDKMLMKWNGQTVVELDRSFLDSNGASKKANIKVLKPNFKLTSKEVTKENLVEAITNVNGASKKGLKEKFNIFSDENTNIHISEEGMVHKFPVAKTTDVSFMSAGFPILYEQDSYLHGYYSVIEAITRLLAMGANPDNARLSMQEYFERLTTEEKWGKPFASLLGAFEVMKAFDLPALGGKDSMSGSYEDLHVPGTLVTFALQVGKEDDVITRSLKNSNSKVVLVEPVYKEGSLDLEKTQDLYKSIYKLMQDKKVYSASTVTQSIFNSLFEMSLGSDFGLEIEHRDDLLDPKYGSLLLEVDESFELGKLIAHVNDTNKLVVGDISFDKGSLHTKHEATLESVYPTLKYETVTVKTSDKGSTFTKREKDLKACVLVLDETANDLTLKVALENADIKVTEVVINSSKLDGSIKHFKEVLNESDVLVLGHGSTKDMQVINPGKEYELFLSHKDVIKDVENFKENKDIIGLGSGAIALSNLGYLGESSVAPIGKHLVQLETVVVSEATSLFKEHLNKTFNLPYLSQFMFEKADENLAVLKTSAQVKNMSLITGLKKDNVIGLLPSIDQTNLEFFKNYNTHMEEKV